MADSLDAIRSWLEPFLLEEIRRSAPDVTSVEAAYSAVRDEWIVDVSSPSLEPSAWRIAGHLVLEMLPPPEHGPDRDAQERQRTRRLVVGSLLGAIGQAA
jgi:hypothetical protein